jgi:hypothetical protein
LVAGVGLAFAVVVPAAQALSERRPARAIALGLDLATMHVFLVPGVAALAAPVVSLGFRDDSIPWSFVFVLVTALGGMRGERTPSRAAGAAILGSFLVVLAVTGGAAH